MQNSEVSENIVVLNRELKPGDVVELYLAMEFRFSRWNEMSLGIERGPLVYALRIDEEWREITIEEYDDTFWEVLPKSPWNYAILKKMVEEDNFRCID